MEVEKWIPISGDAAAKREITINYLLSGLDSPGEITWTTTVWVQYWTTCPTAAGWTSNTFVSAGVMSAEPIGARIMTIGVDTFPFLKNNPREKNQKILQKILKRRGQYLEEITFTGFDSKSFEGSTIKRIVECCPRLKYLNTNMLELNSEDLFARATARVAMSWGNCSAGTSDCAG